MEIWRKWLSKDNVGILLQVNHMINSQIPQAILEKGVCKGLFFHFTGPILFQFQ